MLNLLYTVLDYCAQIPIYIALPKLSKCFKKKTLKMDFIANLLEPYKEIIGKVTGILTIGHMLSAVFLLNDIRKLKTTAGNSIIPFLGGFIL